MQEEETMTLRMKRMCNSRYLGTNASRRRKQ
jgi:hypothetical protein